VTIDDVLDNILDGLEFPTIDAPTESAPVNLPAGFWDERPELAHIRDAAHCRARSSDAVLGVVLARVAAVTPPQVLLPAVVGSTATLDVCVALIGRSGTGKSSAATVAEELVPILTDDVAVRALGSGEGLIESYLELVEEVDANGNRVKVKRQVRRGVLAMLDEGQALAEMGGRTGSTLLPTIRTAWSGGRLGQANATDDRKRFLPARGYRLALVAGFQTEHATALLDDAAAGTPQRFLYFAAEDASIPDDAPPWPGPLEVDRPGFGTGEMELDPAIAAEIRGRALARTRGEYAVDALDAHRDLSRLKVAGLLALLAGRTNIDADDWRLSGDVLDASDRVRSGIAAAARSRAKEAERTGTAKAIRRDADLEDDQTGRARRSMAVSIGRHVHKGECKGGCTRSCVTVATAYKHRRLVPIDDALETAARDGFIVVDGSIITAGQVAP